MMPRSKQGQARESEPSVEVANQNAQNGFEDETKSAKISEPDNPPPKAVPPSSTRRRRTGVVAMSVGSLSFTGDRCEFCGTTCICQNSDQFKSLVFKDKEHDSLQTSMGSLAVCSTVDSSGSNERRSKEETRCQDRLVGNLPIMSSLPWQSKKSEESQRVYPLTTSFVSSATYNWVISQTNAFRAENLLVANNATTALSMPSSVYGIQPKNIEDILSGLQITSEGPKDVSANIFAIPSPEPEVKQRRPRCDSLPSLYRLSPNRLQCQSPKKNDSTHSSATGSETITKSSSLRSLSGYTISRTPKLTCPEVIEQHISKIISENAAIIETQDPLWMKRYMRQSVLGSESNSEDDSKSNSTTSKFRRYSEDVTMKYKNASPRIKSKLQSALLGKWDAEKYAYETGKNDKQNERKSPVSGFKSPINLPDPLNTETHPENPEGSIIKNLLLKDRSLSSQMLSAIEDETSRVSTSSYTCTVCNIEFRSKDNLAVHQLRYCIGYDQLSTSPGLLDPTRHFPGPHTGAVNKRSSSFSSPWPYYAGNLGTGQILKKQLMGTLSVPPVKKRKISEPVFSSTISRDKSIFCYTGLQGQEPSFISPDYNSRESVQISPGSVSNSSLLSMSSSLGLSNRTVQSHGIDNMVTISNCALTSGGTVVNTSQMNCVTTVSNSRNYLSPVVSNGFNLMFDSKVSGTVIKSPSKCSPKMLLPVKDVNGNDAFFNTLVPPVEQQKPISLNSQSAQSSPHNPCVDSDSINSVREQRRCQPVTLVSGSHQKTLVKSPGGQILQTNTIVVPSVVLSPCSPTFSNESMSLDEKDKKPIFKRTKQAAARPTTLALKSKPVTLVGSTIISPETPRPKRNCLQLYINGQAYTHLGLKCSTRSFYCCIYRLQPMYVPQDTNPKLSMYSNWQTYPAKEEIFNKTPGQVMALYNTSHKHRQSNNFNSTARMSDTLVVTHSSYWQFRKREPEPDDKAGEKDTGLPSSSSEKGEKRGISQKACPLGMESDFSLVKHSNGQISAIGNQENGILEKENSIINNEENEEDSRSTRKLSRESVESSRTSISSSGGELTENKLKPPKRVRIFQGGFRSNEDYTYIRGRGRGKYVCEECGIRCKKPSMLKKHIRTHTDLRPYKCGHCAFAFKTKGNLTKHMKSKAHHKKCMELGIVPVPTTIDYSQIDEGALSKQFSDADDDDDEDLDEDADDSDIDEDEEDDSQDQRDDEEGSEWEEQTCDSAQFEDASPDKLILLNSTTPDKKSSTSSSLEPFNDIEPTTIDVSIDNEIQLDQETEAARSLLDLSGLTRPIRNPDWLMASPSSQTRKSEGSVGSMECLSPAIGCIVSTANEILDDTCSEMSTSNAILKMPWPAELSPKFRPRSYSVNVPPSRGNGRKSSLHTVHADHQTRVISFASSLSSVPEDQSEATMTRRYSMSAVGDIRRVYMSSPLPSGSSYSRVSEHHQQHQLQPQSFTSESNLHLALSPQPGFSSQPDEDETGENEILMNMPWTTTSGPVSGEQPMDLRVSKNPKNLFARFPLSVSTQLWKPGLPMTPVSETQSYPLLSSPNSDMLSPDKMNMTDYLNSVNNLSVLNSYVPNGDELGAKDDLNVEMLEASPYSPEAVEFQPPLSPVSQSSLDNDSQSGHNPLEELCVASSSIRGIPNDKMPSLVSASGCMTPMTTSQIEFHLSATVRSASGGQMESEGKCSCSICNKTFSKPSQLRLHVNIHYFERPFRCESCAVSFRTKGHLQKHKRSVSHYNKVNMNMTFGTPTTDNPRPFKCGDCKIAFRIHGHLAKHLRSKMHIMKLECLGKLPFGMYAEMERSGVNLNEIDTTDCENSLESLQVMAHRLYQLDPRRMRWHTADGLEPPVAVVPSAASQVAKETEVTAGDVQSLKMTSPVTSQFSNALLSSNSPSSASVSSDNQLSSPPIRRTSIITSPPHQMYPTPIQASSVPNTRLNPIVSSPNNSASSNQIKREPDDLNCVKPNSESEPLFLNSLITETRSLPVVSESYALSTKVAPSNMVDNNDTLLHRSCTCHLCGRLFKSAKFLQVHLYCDHPQPQLQEQPQWSVPVTVNTPSPVESLGKRSGSMIDENVTDGNQPWMDCDDRLTNGVLAESFNCNICRRQFNSQNNLHQHLLTHAQLRPFVCDICDAGFTSSVLLGAHLTTHQQDKPYMCGECGNSFLSPSDFQRHLQAHLNDTS